MQATAQSCEADSRMPEGLAQETRASGLTLISLVDASGRDLVGAQYDVRLPGVLKNSDDTVAVYRSLCTEASPTRPGTWV